MKRTSGSTCSRSATLLRIFLEDGYDIGIEILRLSVRIPAMKLREAPNKPEHLAACLTFLADLVCVFQGLSDGINCGLFDIAIIFACGYLVALAPLIFGHFE